MQPAQVIRQKSFSWLKSRKKESFHLIR